MKQTYEKAVLAVVGIFGAVAVIWCISQLFSGCKNKVEPVKPVVVDTAWFCTPIAPLPTTEERAVGQRGKFWPVGSTIKIGFMAGGDEAKKTLVRNAYASIAQSANLKFEFPAAGPYNIRVSFSPGSAWSYIGVDCNSISASSPTLNFGFGYVSAEITAGRSIVIEHEALHSTGLLHEHQIKDGICWDEAVVLADMRAQGWSDAQTRFNILDYHDPANVITNGYDQESAMHYAIKAAWTCDKKARAGGTKITDLDRAFVASQYPGVAPPVTGTVTVSKATMSNIIRIEGLAVTYANLAKVYADSALLVTKKATGL